MTDSVNFTGGIILRESNSQELETFLQDVQLDHIVSVQYTEDILIKNFNIIINCLKNHNKNLVVLQKDTEKQKEGFNKLKDDVYNRPDSTQRFINDIAALREEQDASKKEQKEIDKRLLEFKDHANNQFEKFSDLVNSSCPLEDFEELKKEVQSLKLNDTKQNREIEDLQGQIKKLQDQIFGVLSDINSINGKVTNLESNRSFPPIRQNSSVNPPPINDVKNEENQIQFNDNFGDPSQLQDLKHSQQIIQDEIAQIKKTLQSHSDNLSQHDSTLNSHDQEIKLLQDDLSELQKKISNLSENQQGGGGQNLDDINFQLRKLQTELQTMQSQNNIMQTLSMGGGEGGLNENQLAVLLGEISKIRNQLDQYTLHKDFEKEIHKISSKVSMMSQQIDDGLDKLKKEVNIKISSKFDAGEGNKIKEEIINIKEAIFALQRTRQNNVVQQNVQSNDVVNSKQFQALNELIDQLQIELKQQKNIQMTFAQMTNQKLLDLEKKISQMSLDKFMNELQNLRDAMEQIRQMASGADKKVKEMKKQLDNAVKKDELNAAISDNISRLRDEILSFIKQVEDKLKLKTDQEDLSKVEQSMLTKLEEVVQALMKQLANKQETKKALIYLEQKINQIFVSLEGQGDKDGDGLAVKKPLWSCISCDKELDKYKGQLGDYRGWQVFPPKETSPDRMGKFGVGFKMMQEKQKIQKQEMEKNKDLRPISQSNQQLPKLQKQ